MAPGSVTLLAKCRDLADGSEFYPSAFFQHLAEQLHPKEPLPITPQLPPADQLALDDLEALLAGRFSAGFPQLVAGAFPWLVAGQEAGYQRAGTALSRFHGWLGQETPELGPANGQTVFSASRLESLVKCPYQYFLKYVLHIEPPEEGVEEGVYWLHPLEMGKLLHELLCGFMVGLREKGERPDQRLHEKVLKQQLAQKVKAYRQAIPVVYEAAFRADRILVMGANPGRIIEFIENPVPRPRETPHFLSREFLALKKRLEEHIHPPSEEAHDNIPMIRMTEVGDDVE